jgi:hypothetical protein
MPDASTSPGARFAAAYLALWAAHNVADYWAQTTYQATNKGRHGNVHENTVGRQACLTHVATYTGATASAIVSVNRSLGLGANWRGIVLGQVVSSASHYFADRRHTLRKLAERTGRLEFYDSGGAASLDQSWHVGWLAVAALLTATVGRRD